MLMHRTPARVPLPPRADAPAVKPTETLEPSHGHPNLKLLEADGALGRVDAVLFRRQVGKHARPPGRHGRERGAHATATPAITARATAAWVGVGGDPSAIRAVRRDAYVDVRFPQRLVIGQRPGRKLSVAYRALVFLGDLILRLLVLRG